MTPINQKHTSCKNCFFAKYDNNTQVDCCVGLVDKYRESATVEVVEAYDHQKEFYVINNKKCMCYMEEDKIQEDPELKDKTQEEAGEFIRNNRRKLNYEIVVNTQDLSEEDIKLALEELKQVSVLPKMLRFILFPTSKVPLHRYQHLVKESGADVVWRIQSMIEPEPYDIVLHNTSFTTKSKYICSLAGSPKDLHKMINLAQTKVYDNFETFTTITNGEKCYFYNVAVYIVAIQKKFDIIAETEGQIIL